MTPSSLLRASYVCSSNRVYKGHAPSGFELEASSTCPSCSSTSMAATTAGPPKVPGLRALRKTVFAGGGAPPSSPAAAAPGGGGGGGGGIVTDAGAWGAACPVALIASAELSRNLAVSEARSASNSLLSVAKLEA